MDVEALARSYLEAFEARDLARCLEFFHPEATIIFGPGTYAGRQAIEEWHRDRFEAGLKIVRMDQVSVDGETLSAQVTVISERIKSWGLDSLDGEISLRFEQGKLSEARFSLLKGNPLESWSE